MDGKEAAFNKFLSDHEGKRDDLVALARSAEGAERYEDMCKLMERVVKKFAPDSPLTVEERNLLSVAYKNVVGARRASLRSFQEPSELMDVYKKQLKAELKTVCDEIQGLLESLITGQVDPEPNVFYLKMSADYYRYMAECLETDSGNQTDMFAKKAAAKYQAAMDIASKNLTATSPIRLGLALNYSVCLYEIVKEQSEACKLAKSAFDEAISQLDKLDEADYKDATLIMQLLRDNLTLWTADEAEVEEEN